MHSLVMSSCSRDLIVMSLVVYLIGACFLDSKLSTCYGLYRTKVSSVKIVVTKKIAAQYKYMVNFYI